MSSTYVRLIVSGVALSIFLTLGYALVHKHSKVTNEELGAVTVEIVRPDERSGGTGVIISSSLTHSEVLTNNHVCHVADNGGVVIADDGRKYAIVSLKRSKFHDLCLITVDGNLHNTTDLASNAPLPYEEATVSGHPHLLPTIITRGHFSGRIREDIVVGVRPCTEEDLKGPNALTCIFFQGIPIVRNYEMQVVSATIQPGSSGSAVFNSQGLLAGLVFAGSGDLGYGLIVPFEYVYNFLTSEVFDLNEEQPQTTRTLASDSSENSNKKDSVNCNKISNKQLRRLCKVVNR